MPLDGRSLGTRRPPLGAALQETVFETEQFLRFCDAFKLVASLPAELSACEWIQQV